MIYLQLLSGKKSGERAEASHFPFCIGRAPQNDLTLEDDGVWDQHLTLEFVEKTGFQLSTTANAISAVNGKPVDKAMLRNGDVITLGSAKIQFWLAPAPQRGLWLRENFVWALLVIITVAQFIMLFTLLR
ncbi:MAG TPA: FHA domain-containing protein [Pseudomonadales bacterium]|nr:FHA domain-containing protein [Pseudomonadales bacterium]